MRFQKPIKAVFAVVTILVSSVFPLNPNSVPLAKTRIIHPNGNSNEAMLVQSKLKSILIANFNYGFTHSVSTGNMTSTLLRIGLQEGWRVDTITREEELTEARLKNYQVLFANNISQWASYINGKSAAHDAVQ